MATWAAAAAEVAEEMNPACMRAAATSLSWVYSPSALGPHSWRCFTWGGVRPGGKGEEARKRGQGGDT